MERFRRSVTIYVTVICVVAMIPLVGFSNTGWDDTANGLAGRVINILPSDQIVYCDFLDNTLAEVWGGFFVNKYV